MNIHSWSIMTMPTNGRLVQLFPTKVAHEIVGLLFVAKSLLFVAV